MRKRDEQPLKEVIERMLESYQLKDKLNELEIVRCWQRIMGSPIVSKTEKIFVRKKCLYLKINSAPLKQELFYAREKIKERMNEEMGSDVLENVILI